MTALLSIKNCVVAYDQNPVIKDISVDIHPGTFIGLIGPNGAGKTTFMLSISGQFQPRSGSIRFEKMDIYKHNYVYKKQIGYVHEAPFFYDHLTVEEFLIFVARLKGMGKEVISKIDNVLQSVNLSDEKQKLTARLSQGMRKKLAIAAALINTPRLVFLDEALNGIDLESTFQIKKLLADFVSHGGTVILSTHVLEVIEKICDRYIILKSGAIISDVNAHDFEGIGHMDLEQHVMDLLRD